MVTCLRSSKSHEIRLHTHLAGGIFSLSDLGGWSGGGFQEFWKIRARLLPFLSCQDSQRPSEGRGFSAHGPHQAMSNSLGF